MKSAYALALLDPYLAEAPAPIPASAKPERFEDMVSRTLPAVVLILVY